MASANLELLTDEGILDYTRIDGRENILTTCKDIDLTWKRIHPEVGGVYDVEIFGSPFEDRCICGKIRQVSSEPCPSCGARVYSREEGLRRFARIELPFYYLNDLRFDIFKELFDEIFKDTKIVKKFRDNDNLKTFGYSGRSSKKFGIKVFDTCQFEYSKTKNELTISEFITDEKKCSYEGLLLIIEKYFPEKLVDYRKLINRYYLVLPAMMRPYSLVKMGTSTKMHSNKLSIWYSIVLRFCCSQVDDSSNYDEVLKQFNTPGERVRYTALLRLLLNAGKKQATSLLNTSKKNEARDLYSVRVKNSARCPIIPDTEIAVDEIGVPVHVAYEMCREGFVNYLVKELNFTKREAMKSTKEEYGNPELMRRFKEYAEKQYVLGI